MELINLNGFILHQETLPNKDDLIHYHSSYELFIVVKGVTTVLIDDRLISVGEQEIILLKPDVIHKNIGQKLHERYSIHFTDEYLHSCFSDGVAELLTKSFENQKISVTSDTFEQILKLLTAIKNRPPFACIHAAEIVTLLSDPKNMQTAQLNITSKTAGHILEYIRKNYADISGLDDIANGVHISKQYLCQVFKKETGATISEYLNSIRISNACEMLRSGKHTITQTASLCGYNSTAYFCRIFKNVMRMTPREYQKNTADIK